MKKLQFPHILTVTSSAGSGKTYNLALRYLQILLMDKKDIPEVKNNINNILAITFTNKAAMEMRNRILEWMKKIILELDINDKNCYEVVKIPLKTDSGDIVAVTKLNSEINRRIQDVFSNLLKNFSDFRVSTIDSFVSLVLKASAFRLKIPPDFEITKDTQNYFDYVINGIFQDVVDNIKIKNIFDKFIIDYIELQGNKIKWIPKKIISENINSIWGKESNTGKEIIDEVIGVSEISKDKNEIIENICNLNNYLISDGNLDVKQNFLKAISKIIEKKDSAEFFSDSNLENWINKEFDTGKDGLLNKNSSNPDEKYIKLWNETRKLLEKYVESISKYKISSYVKLYKLFLERLEKEITHKRKNILLNELNNRLKKISDDNDFVPEIYYHLSERYFHFLIDEFQDTNYLQWQNLKKFIDESLSKGGSFFLVGDKKQSIYRWRGGAPEIFDEIEKEYKSVKIYPITSEMNFRGDEYVVNFVNDIFDKENVSRWFKNLSYDENKVLNFYKDSFQKFPKEKKGQGYVFVEKIDEEDNKDELKEIIKNKFLKTIERLKEVYNYRDIAVLVRKNDEVKEVVEWLLEKNINVQATSTINIKNHPLIIEIINLLQFLNNPSDNFAFITFVTGDIFYKLFQIDRNEIFKWINRTILDDKCKFLYREFQKYRQDIWEEYFEKFFKNAGYLPLYEFVILIMKKWRILQNFKEYIPYFLQLLEIIKIKENVSKSDLVYFLEYFNNANEEDEIFLLKTPEGLNAIKVMTIHKAKGLEFPVVILPFAKIVLAQNIKVNNKFFKENGEELNVYYITKKYTSFSKKLHNIYYNEKAEFYIDELNNFYVASTRAISELYIFVQSEKDKDGKEKNHLVDLIFNNRYKDKNPIIIGNTKTTHNKKDEVSYQDLDISFFDEDLYWFNLLKTKVRKPEEVSKNRINAQELGNLVHYILSLIEKYPDEKLDEKINWGIKKFNYDDEGIEKIIKDILYNFKRFFTLSEGEKVFVEKEIINEFGEMNKVDRFIERKNFIELIDFKTGEEYKEDHRLQIEKYKKLLKAIYTDKEIFCYLIYTDENKLMEIK